jgi:hypothetical protein
VTLLVVVRPCMCIKREDVQILGVDTKKHKKQIRREGTTELKTLRHRNDSSKWARREQSGVVDTT